MSSSASRAITLFFALCFLPAAARAFSGGPPSDRVMLCGSAGACTNCHNSPGPLPSVASVYELKLAGPPEQQLGAYLPGTKVALLLRFVEGNPARCNAGGNFACALPAMTCGFGFQIASVVDASCPGGLQAGCFEPTPPNQQVVCGGPLGASPFSCSTLCTNNFEYLEHTCGIAPDAGTPDTKTWRFNWTAPPAGAGRVRFFIAVNSVNGNGFNTGDVPHFSSCFFMDEQVVSPVDCDLLRASIPVVTPPVDKAGQLFFGTCDTCRCPFAATQAIPGGPPFVPGFTITPDQDLADDYDDPAADDLIVYQVDCCCAGRLHLTKNTATGKVHAAWMP